MMFIPGSASWEYMNVPPGLDRSTGPGGVWIHFEKHDIFSTTCLLGKCFIQKMCVLLYYNKFFFPFAYTPTYQFSCLPAGRRPQ